MPTFALENVGVMVLSMTGFGSGEARGEAMECRVEVRTVNSKVLDLAGLRMPSALRVLEGEVRALLAERLVRGKVELVVLVRWANGTAPSAVRVDAARLAHEVATARAALLGAGLQCEAGDLVGPILARPDLWLENTEEANEAERALFMQALAQALDRHRTFRTTEGEATRRDLEGHVARIEAARLELVRLAPARLELIKSRLEEVIAHAPLAADQNRLAQELLFYADRLDVNEELKRLGQHCDYFREVMQNEEACGRKLQFIAQEMMREANTLGSKSQDANMQRTVVEVKEVIEQIKEQTFNVL